MSNTTAPAATPRRRRRWRRLLWWLLGLLVLLRLTIWVALPMVLDKVLRDLGFAARWERLDVSLLGGAVELWQLRLAEPGADGAPGTEHLALEYLVADLDVLALLQGQVRVRRAEVDGLRATLREDADGVLHLGPLALGGGEPAPVAEPEPAAADPDRPLDLTPPLHVMAARLQHVAVTLLDRNGRPQEVRLTARVSDFGDPAQPARLKVAVTAPGALAALRLDGTGFARGASAEFDLTLGLDGLRPRALTPWLARAGLAPASDDIDAALRLRGRLAPSDADGRVAAGEILLEGLRVAADHAEAVALDRLRVALPAVSHAALDARLELAGVRALAEQRPDGALRVAGLDLLPSAATTPSPPPAAPNAAAGPGPALALAADLREVAFTLRDGRVSPPRDLTLRLDELLLQPAAAGDGPQRLRVRLGAPGIAGQIQLEGSVRPFGPVRSADLALTAGPFDGALLADLLRPAGLRPTFTHGSLGCQIVAEAAPQPDGTTKLHAAVRDLVVLDQIELLRWPLLEAHGTAGDAWVLDRVTVEGPEVQATIGADGRLAFLGLVVEPPDPASTAPAPPGPPPAPAPAAGPGVGLGLLTWNGGVLHLRDESVSPPVTLMVGPIRFQAERIDLAPGAEPGVLSLATPIRGVCREFAVTTLFGPGAEPGSLQADLRGQVQGLTLQSLSPWLARMGLASELQDGRLDFAISGGITPTEAGPRADLFVRRVALRDGETEHLGFDELVVREAVLGADLSVTEVSLQRPRASLGRDADGTLHFAGLRTLPAAPAAAGTPAPAAPAPAAPQPAGGFALGKATIQDLALAFRDAAGAAPRQWTASLGASVENLRPGGDEPARITLRADVPGLLRGAELQASAGLGDPEQRVQGSLQVAAIDQPGLAALLPPGTTADVPATAFRADFALGAAPHPDGGQRADLSLGPLELRTADGRELLSLDVARLTVNRHDPAAGVLHVGAVRTGGLTLTAERHADGALSALGLRLPPPPAAAATPTAGADGPPAPPLAGLRDVVVDALEIARIELRLRDAASPAAEPLVASLGLASVEPLRLLGPEPDLLPPVRLQFTGAVLPLCRDITATLEARPFAPEPSLDLTLGIDGIDGEGLRRAFPALADRVRSDGLAEGSLGAEFHVHAQPRQATQGPFDWSREFALDAELIDLHFRAAADGPVLAGVDAVRLTAPRITPATGAVHVSSLEVTRPRLHARQSAEGVHVMGLLLPPAPAAAEPAVEATLTAEPDAGALPAGAPAPAPRPDAGEVRIDAILVQGIDLHWRDETVTPPLEVPFDMLDAEVTGFTTRAFTEPETILFRASMGLGRVELPRRYRSGLLGSLVNAAGQAAGIQRPTETVQRPLLEELAIRGKLALAPSLRWELTADISTFELTGLRGVANQGGVAIGDGTVDATIDLAYAVGPGLQTDAEIVFRDLSLSEPAGGPISRYLRLPAPLDTVLFVLRNDQNEQRIPLRFRVGQQGMSTDRIVGMAVTTLSTLITKAIATSPLRVLGGITDFAGLTGGVGMSAAERARTVTFAPGSVTPPLAATAALQDLVAEAQDGALLVLQHELGGADVKIARQLATPPTADTLTLLADLRHRRAQLLQQRERALRELRVQIGIEGFDHPRLREGMRTIDRELGRIEQALDEALELLRPDAARRADARARRAALAAAERRLEALRDQLVREGAPPDRIELRRPRFLAADCDCGSTITVTPRIRSAR